MVKEQRENCAIGMWDRESLIESTYLSFSSLDENSAGSVKNFNNVLQIGAELVETIGNFSPSD